MTDGPRKSMETTTLGRTGDGYLLCGHGSRDAASTAGFERIAAGLARLLDDRPFAHGFMELAEPDFDQAIGTLARAGVERVLAVPAFLFAAGHVRRDLPRLLAAAADRHGVEWRTGHALGADWLLIQALVDRAMSAAPGRAGMALLLVGAGSSDQSVNARLPALANTIGRMLGTAAASAAFASTAMPSVAEAVRRLAAQRFNRILLLPWFLTEGRLLAQARAEARVALGAGGTIIGADALGDHPWVLEALVARARALADPDPT